MEGSPWIMLPEELRPFPILDQAGQRFRRRAQELEPSLDCALWPARAGIDPHNKLIDRNPGDNARRVREGVN